MAYGLLKGKRGVIFGALDEHSIATHVAKRAIEEGAEIVLTNAPVAFRAGTINKLAEEIGVEAIPADATSVEDLDNLFKKAVEILGGKIDFVLHSIGMSVNIRKNREYFDLNYDWMQKTYDISAISFHKMMQVAYKQDALNEGGSIIALTYIAADRTFPFYGEMAEAKAILESYARSFGYHLGERKRIRVNTVSQSPTMTKAGSGIKGFQEFFEYSDKMSPLGNADAESCADYCMTLFSDLTRMVTMQNLYHDGGFSKMGMHPGIMSGELRII
ncbi:MAG TPA: SDR family oxidoreductase [Bacteroidetes bacterium]|nr:SDR family oxidoreductase [Bacteroidota bacterium]